MRDSQYKSCAVQNQFTAYLIAAIRNYKRTYLRRISTALRTELPMEGHSEVMELCEETDFFCGLPLMQRLENERLFAAMQGLSERERYIFLSKVLGEMSLSEIALSLGITYGAPQIIPRFPAKSVHADNLLHIVIQAIDVCETV